MGAQGAKQLGLLRELVPQAAVIGMLVDPNMPWAESLTTNTQAAARAVGLQLVVLGASTERDIDAALATFVQQRASALLITASPFFFTQTDYLIALVNIERNPTASATAASASCTEAGRSSESPFRLARA